MKRFSSNLWRSWFPVHYLGRCSLTLDGSTGTWFGKHMTRTSYFLLPHNIWNKCKVNCFNFKHFITKNTTEQRLGNRLKGDSVQKLRREGLDLHRLLAWVQHNSCWHHFATFDDIILQHLMTSFWMTCIVWILIHKGKIIISEVVHNFSQT